jgi:hypothetical protein
MPLPHDLISVVIAASRGSASRSEGGPDRCGRGATFAAVAAARITPPLNGLVSISGVRQYDGYDAEQAMRNLLVPTMFVAADQDRNTYLDARTLFDAMPAKGVLLEVAGEQRARKAMSITASASVSTPNS